MLEIWVTGCKFFSCCVQYHYASELCIRSVLTMAISMAKEMLPKLKVSVYLFIDPFLLRAIEFLTIFMGTKYIR